MSESELLGYGCLLAAAWLFGRGMQRLWQRFGFMQRSFVIEGVVQGYQADPVGGELQRPVIAYQPYDGVELCFVADIYRKQLATTLPIGRAIPVRFLATAPQQVELAGFMPLWGGVIGWLLAAALALMIAMNNLPDAARHLPWVAQVVEHAAPQRLVSAQPLVENVLPQRLASSEFARIAPLPEWWGEVEADVSQVHNYRQLLDFWVTGDYVGDERQYYARRAFKGFYQMILANEHNPDIVVPAIMLMDVVGRKDYPALDQLLQYALDHYYDYNKLVEYCTGCMVGDTIANIVDSRVHGLAQQQPQQAMAMIEEFRARRGEQTSDYIKARLTVSYAYILQRQNQTEQALNELRQALQETQHQGSRQQLERYIKHLSQ